MNKTEIPKALNGATMIKQKKYKKNEKTEKQKKNKKQKKNINILYANPDGITGKVTSLITAARTAKAHIIGLAETKLNKTHPRVEGYEWINKPRNNRRGGGVAMLIREDIYHQIETVDDLEDQDQEILWIKLNTTKSKVFIGIFYGPQEKCSNEEAERQYAQITSQINKLKSKGEVILMGDFNAKLEIDKENVKQELSRNGKHMLSMLNVTNTTPITLHADVGIGTRARKRKDIIEKSIIDYVIMTSEIEKNTNLVHIDEAGIYKLKGKEETDHNTIILEVEIPTKKKITKNSITNYKDSEGWHKFNKAFEKKCNDCPPSNYDEYENILKKIIKSSFKTITVEKGNYKYKKSDLAKQLKKDKKVAKKDFEKAKQENKYEKLEIYLEKQKLLRNELETNEKQRVEDRINLIIKEGGAGSDHFWKIRRKIMSQGRNETYDLITEDGTQITDPEKSKELIADFYENLYQARPGTKEYEQWTKKITDEVHRIKTDTLKAEPEFTNDEYKTAIKSLKRGKSNGPDNLPNEIFI